MKRNEKLQPKRNPLILMYHRIARSSFDVWDMSVSPENFEQQLVVLSRTRRPLPLKDFVRKLASGTLPSDAVAVTFDDGYVDNLTAAKPRLSAADVPATIFVTTGYLDRPGEFWWDELPRLVLSGQGLQNFELMAGGKAMQIDLGTSAVAGKPEVGSKQRSAALTAIWEAMRRLNENERQATMAQIRSILADCGSVDRGRAMTKDEVRAIASDGLVAIGAHTVTHPLLSTLRIESYQDEISCSKSACEALIGTEVAGFAYPYGDFNSGARQAVSAAGFAFACTTRHAPARRDSDVLALPRIHVRNWDGDTFERLIDEPSAGVIQGAFRALREKIAPLKTFVT